MIGRGMTEIRFDPHDIWIGLFWTRYRLATSWQWDAWLCPFPTIALHVRWYTAAPQADDSRPGDIG